MNNDIYETSTANNNQQTGNWLERNSEWLTPLATSAATIGYNIYANQKNNEFNAQQAELNRQFNAAEAEKNRQYEAQMSNTAVTRAMQDYKNAGMNPHLAGGGGPASTPAGGSASGTAATTTGMMPADFSNINAYSLQTAMTKAQIDNMTADTDLKAKQAGKTEAETESQKIDNQYKDQLKQLEVLTAQITNEKQKAETEKVFQEVHKMEKEIRKMDEEIGILKSEGKIKEAEAKTRTRNRRAYAILEMTESATRSIGNLVGAGAKAAAVGQNAIKAFEM